jgi:hypothetical protein
MKIAKVEGGQVAWVKDYTEIFGNAYVTQEDLTIAGYTICSFRQFDQLTEKSVPSEPIFSDGVVWIDAIAPLTEQEIQHAKSNALERVRIGRNALLANSDYTQLSDYPHADKAAWSTYRQALRDIPQSIDDARVNVNWPIAP